jgi:prepilin-type N-terminal cleavage/methylation domain-containing protein
MYNRGQPSGFTLIELMLVVAIIGLLASIAIPKFAGLIIKSKEAAVKGQLGGLRSAISIYYSDNEGIYPDPFTDLAATLVPKYIDAIASIRIPTVPLSTHPYAKRSRPDRDDSAWGAVLTSWYYDWSTRELFVNCTHLDSTGRVWSTY